MNQNINGNRNYRDSLFKFIFGNSEHKEFTLSLYNALTGRNHDNPDDLIINTIHNILYIRMYNDVSFLISDELFLLEQQSTGNPNIPFRMLEYCTSLLKSYVDQKNYNRYAYRMFALPAPHFIVFYNGDEKIPETSVQRLSDMYENHLHGDLELNVTVYNINDGYNTVFKKKCQSLLEYTWVTDQIRLRIQEYGNERTAIGTAITEVIDRIPGDFAIRSLLFHQKNEVITMLTTEYDEKLHEQAAKDYAEIRYNEGEQAGKEKGRKEGIQEGIQWTAIQAFKSGCPIEQISEYTGLSIDQIHELIHKHN